MPISTVFGMMVMALLHLCPGEDFGTEHINAWHGPWQRAESQTVPLLLWKSWHVQGHPTPSTEIRSRTWGYWVPILYFIYWCWDSGCVLMDVSSAGDLKTPHPCCCRWFPALLHVYWQVLLRTVLNIWDVWVLWHGSGGFTKKESTFIHPWLELW